jgi:polyhydroxyalkanoate synthase subunit PhaC
MATTSDKQATEAAGAEPRTIPFLEPAQLLSDMTAMSLRIMKGMQHLKAMTEEDIAVGTTPREHVLDVDGGKIKLYRYNNDKITSTVPLLISFALVNKEYILDLEPDRSFIKKMLELGHDVYTIDWGYPTRADRFRQIDDYVYYLDDCIQHIRKSGDANKIHLMGICQGGTFALMYAALYPQFLQTLTTVVTPFEFGLDDSLMLKWAKDVDPDPIADALGMISGEAMNAGFIMVKPMQRLEKFHAFLNMMDDKPKMQNFLRMEKWVFDSPGQPGEAYREYTRRVFINNELSRGELVVHGKKVNLKNITMPVLTVYAKQDHLVPPASTRPIHDAVGAKDKELVEFPGGHVGVFVSGQAQKVVAPAIAQWLHARS